MEPHTRAKHVILRRYLEAWIPVMSRRFGRTSPGNAGRLLIVDGFAGPGRYEQGEEGSPLIALRAFMEHKRRDEIHAELVYRFIEERRDRARHLRDEVARLNPPRQVNWNVIADRYENVVSRALDVIERRRVSLPPTFTFLDPFGYTGAPMRLTARLLAFRHSEALVYMPLPFVNRFLARAGQQRALDGLFGTDRWRDAIGLIGKARQEFLHKLFQEQLRFKDPNRIVRSFAVSTAEGNGYRLYFTTASETGLEKMKEAMWSADPRQGEHYADTTGGELVLFKPEPDTGPLLRALQAHFGDRSFTIEEAMRFALLHTAFLPRAHLKKRTLAGAEQAGRLEVVSRPPAFGVRPPHCLKKNATRSLRHCRQSSSTHSVLSLRWRGPDSPPAMSQWMPSRRSPSSGPSSGSALMKRTAAGTVRSWSARCTKRRFSMLTPIHTFSGQGSCGAS